MGRVLAGGPTAAVAAVSHQLGTTNICSIMTLPGFTAEGLLPPTPSGDPYVCDADGVRSHLVDLPGGQDWRRRLFDGWDLMRSSVSVIVPSARWWLWGCFVSNHAEPLWGDLERIDAVVILPASDVPTDPVALDHLLGYLRGAHEHHDVDVSFVLEVPSHHPHYTEVRAQLDGKWRPRATKGVADHRTRVLVPAGFIEVAP